MKICTATMWTLLLGFVPAVASAQSLDGFLNGSYDTTLRRTCAIGTEGFGPTGDALGPVETQTASVQATAVYNGDGTGTLDGTFFGIFNQRTAPGSFPLVRVAFSCTLAYTVRPDRTFGQDLACTGTLLNGPAAGATFSSTGIHHEGTIGRGRRTLILTDTEANIETTVFSFGTTFQNTCNRSATALRVP